MKFWMSLLKLSVSFLVLDACAHMPGQLDLKPFPESGPFRYRTFDRATPTPRPDHSLKIVSYNVNFLPNPAGIARDIATIPELADADFIFLQEATGSADGSTNGAWVVGETLGMNALFSPGVLFNGQEYGNAILSRYPLSSIEKFNLPLSTSEGQNQRIALVAQANVDGMDITVSSMHLAVRFPNTPTTDSSRANQADYALERLGNGKHPNLIIGGDFNTANPLGTATLVARFLQYGLVSIHTATSRTFKNWPLKLDHIFGHDWRSLKSGIAQSAIASDHYPIWTIIVPNSPSEVRDTVDVQGHPSRALRR